MKHQNTNTAGPDHGLPFPARPNDRAGIQALLERLSLCPEAFGIKGRHVSLLRLISRYAREFTSDCRPVIFASNKTLTKAGGTSIPTLQRTLREMESAGIIFRNHSPNGKRYARRDEYRALSEAYGIDLSPLVDRHEDIERAARDVEAHDLHIQIMRDRLSVIRKILPDPSEALIEVTAILRRKKPRLDVLIDLVSRMTALISAMGRATRHTAFTPVLMAPVDAAPEGTEGDVDIAPLPDLSRPGTAAAVIAARAPNDDLTPSASQIDMHHQRSIHKNFDKKGSPCKTASPDREMSGYCNEDVHEDEAELLTAREVADACPDAMSFAPVAPRNWGEHLRLAQVLAPSIGIRPDLMHRAMERLGHAGFAVTIFCLIERLGSIRCHAAYLSKLISEGSRFSPAKFMRSIANA